MIDFDDIDFTLRTNSFDSDDIDSQCSTRFRSMQSLQLFKAWIEHVHRSLDDSKLTEDELISIGFNMYDHEILYYLYKCRGKLREFVQKICEYEGTVNRTQALERGVSFNALEFNSEDPLPKNL